MKLTEIKNIQSLGIAQSQTVKGGARDTRGGNSSSTSTLTLPIK